MDWELLKPCTESEVAEALHVASLMGPDNQLVKFIRRLAFQRGTLIQQRDALLEACELLLPISLPRDVSGMAMREKALAAIKKAKGISSE